MGTRRWLLVLDVAALVAIVVLASRAPLVGGRTRPSAGPDGRFW